MNYNQADNILHKLMSLNWEIKKKGDEIKGARIFNRLSRLDNKFDIPKLNLELKELELEYNRIKREL